MAHINEQKTKFSKEIAEQLKTVTSMVTASSAENEEIVQPLKDIYSMAKENSNSVTIADNTLFNSIRSNASSDIRDIYKTINDDERRTDSLNNQLKNDTLTKEEEEESEKDDDEEEDDVGELTIPSNPVNRSTDFKMRTRCQTMNSTNYELPEKLTDKIFQITQPFEINERNEFKRDNTLSSETSEYQIQNIRRLSKSSGQTIQVNILTSFFSY
jgi:hypothetical protein